MSANIEPEFTTWARADRYLRVVGHIPSLVNELTVITGIVAVLLYFVSSGQNVADLLPVLAMFGVAGIRIVGMISSLVTNVHTLQYQGSGPASLQPKAPGPRGGAL